jgi:type IV pilus assembly protein PilE
MNPPGTPSATRRRGLEINQVSCMSKSLMAPAVRCKHQGFTLIELMVSVAIIGILSAIALPMYKDHVLQGRLVDATNTLSSLRVQMEQHYQDNRTYKTVSGATSPCASASGTTAGAFSISCTSTITTWSATATGSNTMSGFAYTINQDGVMGTTALPSKWGGTSSSCWILSKGASC